MLAIKLHKTKRPWLGTGSYLIPVLDWRHAKPVIAGWIRTLNRNNQGRPNNAIRYITLVSLPPDHLVSLHFDWVEKMIRGTEFRPLSSFSAAEKRRVCGLGAGPLPEWAPELILGAPLGPRSIKWTKDVRPLYSHRRDR